MPSLKKKKVLMIMGTRPEAIKLAPVYQTLKSQEQFFDVDILATAQHREMLDQALLAFGISPKYDLNVMRHNQDLYDVTAQSLLGLRDILQSTKVDSILVQGDTTSTFVGALAGFYQKIFVGHVEAGLRTNDKFSPYPEEINRRLTSCLADIHFAPTEKARENLIREDISEQEIIVTGNTAIDSLLWAVKNTKPTFESFFPRECLNAIENRFILLTMHRRESFGQPLLEALAAVAELAAKYPAISILFPVHLNPKVRRPVEDILANINNIHLLEPLDYVNFVHLMNRATIIMTDSGGIQEEAPSLNKPILVLREVTERPEGVLAGVAKLVGTNRKKIVAEATNLLTNDSYYQSMVNISNPYGDGTASAKLVDALKKRLC